MRVRIHRGAHEVGGTCIEVESTGWRLVLDVGRPLNALRDEFVPLPDVEGLSDSDPSLLGLLISHGHQDHWGLIDQVSKKVPVHIGEATHRILREAAFFSTGVSVDPAGLLVHRQSFTLGPFTVTPFLNDHSAFDTYSMLVEADGKRLFYSADFQAHGRKAAIFEEFLRNPPKHVDTLLLEGTNLSAEGDPKIGKTEKEIEGDLIRAMKETPGIVLAMYSAQNVDRLVTMFRASVRSGRQLVLDLYGASIAAATGNVNIPKAGFEKLLVYVPLRQRILVKESGEFDRVSSIRMVRIFPEELADRASELVLSFRASMRAEIEKARCLRAASAVWSMWPGYLQQPGQKPLLQFFERNDIRLVIHHASGHAYLADLQRLAKAVEAHRVVPIHTFAPGRFADYFDNVEIRPDGEWWAV